MTKVPPGLRCLAISRNSGCRIFFGSAANGIPDTMASYWVVVCWRIFKASPSMS